MRRAIHERQGETDMTTNSAPMNPRDAARIQSHADRTGTNQDFKARAQAAASKPSTPVPQHPAAGSTGAGKK
jgi:hypothetical protein